MLTSASIAAPEAIGVIVWWGVVLAGPVILVRRYRRKARMRHARPSWMPWRRSASGRWGGAEANSVARAASAAAGAESEEAGERAPTPPGEGVDEWIRTDPGAVPVWASRGEHDRRRSRLGSIRPGRLSPGTLEPLCRFVDFRRRLELAASELVSRLAQLPADRWRIEPYPLTGERRNTLLVIGETGVFVISATYGPGHWDDVVAVSRLASKIGLLLPDYSGQVHPAICQPFTSIRPRIWHRPDERGEWIGAWLVGGDSVIEWLEHFGPEHGLGSADLARFDRLTRPNWLQAAIPTARSWPPIGEAASPDWQE
jgi:hypothetical protein